MKKTNFSIPVQKFGTIKSKYQPESNYVSPDEFTRGSNNFITNVTGAIEKRPTDLQYDSAGLSGVSTDQFEAIFTNGTHHLLLMDSGTLKYTSGDTIIHTVQAGYTALANMEYAMYQNRVYFDNGVDSPGVYDLTISYGGVTYSPPLVKSMGAQAPGSAVTFNADSSGGSVPLGGHRYVVTFLYYGFEESNGGTASALHTVSSPNQTVNLSTIPVGGYGVTARKIYRDNGDGNYLLIGTILDNTTVIFADTVSAGTTPIPVANNLPPVFGLIVLNLSRLWVAEVSGTPTTLYWSNPGLPDIFDPNNFVVCNPKDPITALAVYQGTVYVFNRHSFGQILGNTDDTFYYQEFPGSVGCTDNRSIQVRTINGVPVLIFLSDRGLWAFNGSSVEYISDAIEDEVNLNIQQVNLATGSNNQSSAADFAGGTASGGIDLATNPGEITTINPEKVYESDADWEGGSDLLNAATKDGLNVLHPIASFTPAYADGTLSGAAINSSNTLTLPIASDFTGADAGTSFMCVPNALYFSTVHSVASPISIPRGGAINRVTFRLVYDHTYAPIESSSVTVKLTLWNDSFGSPGSILVQSSAVIYTPSGDTYTDVGFSNYLANFSVPTAGTYWIGIVATSSASHNPYNLWFDPTGGISGSVKRKDDAGTWNTVNLGLSPANPSFNTGDISYTYTQAPVPQSGGWISPIFDSFSDSMQNAFFTLLKTFGSGASGTLTISASDDPLMLSGITTLSFVDGTWGTNISVAISNLRYWRLSIAIAITDDRNSLVVQSPTLSFPTTSTWISQLIDCTSDVTAYNQLLLISSGSGNTITLNTSNDGISFPDGFLPLGSAPVRRYAKIQIITGVLPAYVTSATFDWSLASVFESSVIDTGQTPAGWGLFQDVSATNGGTLIFYMRSAATALALASATYYVVSNGNYPNPLILPLEFTQWKIVFTSTANNLPTVDSVTVNWFTGSNARPIRVASLFFNKTYYLAAAESSQPTNNVVIVWDWEGNWRLFRNVDINSMSLFFNNPFYLDSVRPHLYQWLVPLDGTGAAISMDVRTKAFDANDHGHLKFPRSLRVSGLNTGTTIHAYYSTDRGQTFNEMLNVQGLPGYTTPINGNKFHQYFVPDYSSTNSLTGVSIMFRITSTDAYPCSITSFDPEIVVREGKYLEVEI